VDQQFEKSRRWDRLYFKMKAAINIPGFKPRVITHNRQPNSRGYVLEWRVPTTEGAFCASFLVPVQEEEG
jgi:hypothetical protein